VDYRTTPIYHGILYLFGTMADYTQMHVFFAVTTAAVILFTAFLCAVLVAFFRLLRTLDRIAQEVEEETQNIREDLNDLREDMHKGFRFVPFFHFFGKAAMRAAKQKKARKRVATKINK
jgi:hypothetical protein